LQRCGYAIFICSKSCKLLNDFMYAEMAGRRSLVTEAIKKLVRHGILKVKNNRGYQYKITDYGLEISNGFHSTYAQEYRRVSRLSAKKYSCKNDEELLQEIQYRPIAN
uniref:ABC-three component system middle component 2 n=1 Tax=Megasphaera sp. TaxID=2023260 RepID=UPI0025C5B82F